MNCEPEEERPIHVAEIIDRLTAEGFTATRKTLAMDIGTLMAHGIEVVCNKSRRNQYFVSERHFELPEFMLLVDDNTQFADWSIRADIKNQLNVDLTVLLYKNGYPLEWDEEVFEKVLEQADNFKKYCTYKWTPIDNGGKQRWRRCCLHPSHAY